MRDFTVLLEKVIFPVPTLDTLTTVQALGERAPMFKRGKGNGALTQCSMWKATAM